MVNTEEKEVAEGEKLMTYKKGKTIAEFEKVKRERIQNTNSD